DYFIVSSSFLQNISFKVSRFDNLTVLRVFCESGIFNKAFQFFSSKFSFKIDYKTKDGVAIFSCNNDFFIEKTKVKPGDRYTSPFTDMLSCPEDGHSEARIHNEAWYVLNYKLSQERYDPIRNTDGFRKVTEALASIAE
ncbi:MAG: hypothetical protein IKQ18_03190, partial [Clostridia bacterium]|nr:hypothetical protein [Clostridia bacterium]